MALGLFEQIAEEARAAEAASVVDRLGPDDRYWKSMSYAFHLHLPDEVLVFPLVMNPDSISVRQRFTADISQLQEGGVEVEENGITIFDVSIQGRTGVQPRYTGTASVPLSGQAHFLHLRDACFGRYSALKKDRTIGHRVFMTFHNYKDSDHWIVVPRTVNLDRTREKNFQYPYTIEMTAVGEYANRGPQAEEDDGVLRAIGDATASIIVAVGALDGAMRDLNLIASSEIANAYANVTDVLAEVTKIAGAAREMARGTKATIALPLRALTDTRDTLDSVVGAVATAAFLPADAVQLFREMQDALDVLMTYPEKFTDTLDDAASTFLELVAGPANATDAQLDVAAGGTITQSQQLSTTALRPGDQERVNAGMFRTGRTFPRYTGFREIEVLHGDSITAIAAREMGDARRWLDIVLANQLRAPYVSEAGLPDTVRAGDRLSIPTTDAVTTAPTVRSAGDPETGASQLDALLGTDFQIEMLPTGLYSFVVDTAHGSNDFRSVSGVANIEQAVRTMLSIERGTYLLYMGVGYPRLVGAKGTVERIIEARGAIIDTLLQDNRIARVKSASFVADQDVVAVDVEAVVTDNRSVRAIARVHR